MICPACHGRRTVAGRPCEECGGFGEISCCDGAVGGAGEIVNAPGMLIFPPANEAPKSNARPRRQAAAPSPRILADADDLDAATVAARLGKSPRWLQQRLTEDRRQPQPRLQFHHYTGRSPRWHENQYQALRRALLVAPAAAAEAEAAPRPGSPSSSETVSFTFREPSASPGQDKQAAASALERVLAYPRGPKTATRPTRSAAKKKPRSAIKSSTGSVLPFRSRSRPSST